MNLSEVKPYYDRYKTASDEKKTRKAKCIFCGREVKSQKNLKEFKEIPALSYDQFNCECLYREIL